MQGGKIMLQTIQKFLNEEGISLFAPVRLRDCRITRPYLLTRCGIADGTAILFAVPYLAKDSIEANLSAYAIPRDYHLYFKQLFAHILPYLSEAYPEQRFAGFSDHSPIDEVHAAAIAGLGIMGDHGLLITKPYSSFVFLGEIITDAILPATTQEIETCRHCGACRNACPVGLDKSKCLSALTQKKGELSEEERTALRAHPLVWGCDICQNACPHTIAAMRAETLYQAPDFFCTYRLPHLTVDMLDNMSDDLFAERAYAWRGRAVIRRNLIEQK